MLQGKILTPTKRIRRTPFSSKIEDQVKGVTVYNHMILPTIFKDAEEDCRHLKSEVQVWDVSVQRQVEIVGKDAATLLELLTPRNVKDMNPNKCLYAPMVNQNGGMINDPVLYTQELLVLRLLLVGYFLKIPNDYQPFLNISKLQFIESMKNFSKNNSSGKNSKKYKKNSDSNFYPKNTNSSKKTNKFLTNIQKEVVLINQMRVIKGKVTFHL